MHRHHIFEYIPILVGGVKKYIIDLPVEASPVRFWTITSPMQSWDGQVLTYAPECATVALRVRDETVVVEATPIEELYPEFPCVVMEHLKVDGTMEYMVGKANIMRGGKNFVNYGIPNGRHVRIDIYTGESRIIDG